MMSFVCALCNICIIVNLVPAVFGDEYCLPLVVLYVIELIDPRSGWLPSRKTLSYSC